MSDPTLIHPFLSFPDDLKRLGREVRGEGGGGVREKEEKCDEGENRSSKEEDT